MSKKLGVTLTSLVLGTVLTAICLITDRELADLQTPLLVLGAIAASYNGGQGLADFKKEAAKIVGRVTLFCLIVFGFTANAYAQTSADVLHGSKADQARYEAATVPLRIVEVCKTALCPPPLSDGYGNAVLTARQGNRVWGLTVAHNFRDEQTQQRIVGVFRGQAAAKVYKREILLDGTWREIKLLTTGQPSDSADGKGTPDAALFSLDVSADTQVTYVLPAKMDLTENQDVYTTSHRFGETLTRLANVYQRLPTNSGGFASSNTLDWLNISPKTGDSGSPVFYNNRVVGLVSGADLTRKNIGLIVDNGCIIRMLQRVNYKNPKRADIKAVEMSCPPNAPRHLRPIPIETIVRQEPTRAEPKKETPTIAGQSYTEYVRSMGSALGALQREVAALGRVLTQNSQTVVTLESASGDYVTSTELRQAWDEWETALEGFATLDDVDALLQGYVETKEFQTLKEADVIGVAIRLPNGTVRDTRWYKRGEVIKLKHPTAELKAVDSPTP